MSHDIFFKLFIIPDGYKICLLKAVLNCFFRFITFYKILGEKSIFYQSKTAPDLWVFLF